MCDVYFYNNYLRKIFFFGGWNNKKCSNVPFVRGEAYMGWSEFQEEIGIKRKELTHWNNITFWNKLFVFGA